MKRLLFDYILIMVLMTVGGGMIVVNSNSAVFLGLFLWTWGNNIDIRGKF